MTAIDPQPATLPYAAAYLIHSDAVDSVNALLQASGLRISPAHGSGTQIPRYLITNPHKRPKRGNSLNGLLNEREMQVLHGMARGKTNGDIARELYLSDMTIKTYAASLFKKLGARDRANAVAIGYERGILGGEL